MRKIKFEAFTGYMFHKVILVLLTGVLPTIKMMSTICGQFTKIFLECSGEGYSLFTDLLLGFFGISGLKVLQLTE